MEGGEEEDKVVLETVNEEEEEEGKRNREPPIIAFIMVWFGCAYCLLLSVVFQFLFPSFLPSFPGERTHTIRYDRNRRRS